MITETLIKRWMRENGGSILYDPLHPNVFSGYVNWTPERSNFALKSNTRNRPMKYDNQVLPLINILNDNLWDDNVSKINFESSGILSDGQHRLKASVDSGKSFRCLVTWGVGRSAQLVTDRRGSRTLYDDMTIDGFKNSKNLAAIARILFAKSKGATVRGLMTGDRRTYRYPDAVVYRWFLDNSELCIYTQKLVSRMQDLVKDLRINGYVMNVLVSEFNSVSSDDALEFWKRLSSGIVSRENDPIVWLRKRLTDNARSNTSKIPKMVTCALIIKAWNFYIMGESTKQLKFTAGGAKPETFPEICNPYAEDEKDNLDIYDKACRQLL